MRKIAREHGGRGLSRPYYIAQSNIASHPWYCYGIYYAVKTIGFTTASRRAFRKLPQDVQRRIEAALQSYGESGTGDVKKMTKRAGARLRIGDYRVIFTESKEAIEVRAVGHRRDIYR
jgi:mRNA interferase RelE/StbE